MSALETPQIEPIFYRPAEAREILGVSHQEMCTLQNRGEVLALAAAKENGLLSMVRGYMSHFSRSYVNSMALEKTFSSFAESYPIREECRRLGRIVLEHAEKEVTERGFIEARVLMRLLGRPPRPRGNTSPFQMTPIEGMPNRRIAYTSTFEVLSRLTWHHCQLPKPEPAINFLDENERKHLQNMKAKFTSE